MLLVRLLISPFAQSVAQPGSCVIRSVMCCRMSRSDAMRIILTDPPDEATRPEETRLRFQVLDP